MSDPLDVSSTTLQRRRLLAAGLFALIGLIEAARAVWAPDARNLHAAGAGVAALNWG